MTCPQLIIQRLKPFLFILLLVPLARLLRAGFTDDLGANPVETLTHQTGLWALRLLLLTLAITPLCRLTGVSEFLRLRRMIGLYSFVYALLHFITYAVLEHALDMTDILTDVVKRPYVAVGFCTLLMLIPLAATSHNRIIRLLGGRRWKRLHRLVYLCGLGGVLHYLWLVKADTLAPLLYLGVFLGLMWFRVSPKMRAKMGGLLRRVGWIHHNRRPSKIHGSKAAV